MKKLTSLKSSIVGLSLITAILFTSCENEIEEIEIVDSTTSSELTKAKENGRQVLEFKTYGGVNKSMTKWGIGWVGNTAQNVERMGGAGQVDYIRIGCPKEWPLKNGYKLSSDAIAEMDKQLSAAEKAPKARIGCVCSGGNGINQWYVDGDNIKGTRWLKLFKAMKKHIESKGKKVAFIEVGNEQDFNNKKGTPSNINNIQARFKADSEMQNIPLVGPSPLNAGKALGEYNQMKNTTDWGATHAINGVGSKYIDFVKQVRKDGKPYWGSEIHNLVEMLIAAEYDGIGGLWWSPIKVNQGLFMQYNQRGNRLGYTEIAETFSAGAAYRDDTQNNTVHVFLASKFGEKFRIKVKNKNVRFNGGSPTKTFDVDVPANTDAYIKITW